MWLVGDVVSSLQLPQCTNGTRQRINECLSASVAAFRCSAVAYPKLLSLAASRHRILGTSSPPLHYQTLLPYDHEQTSIRLTANNPLRHLATLPKGHHGHTQDRLACHIEHISLLRTAGGDTEVYSLLENAEMSLLLLQAQSTVVEAAPYD